MHVQRISTIILFCLLVQSPEVFSQILLHGTVTDNGGEYFGNGAEPVINALVTLTDQADSNRTFSSYTNEQGQYSIVIEATGIAEPGLSSPNDFTLLQNYPNPFNPTTVILYELAQPGHIRIDVHNILGQKIRTLLNGYQANEKGKVIWEGTDDRGIGVSAGIYIYSLSAEGFRTCKKMVLLDGHRGKLGSGMLDRAVPEGSVPMFLGKTTGNLYRLQVKGDDIEPYEQSDIVITENMMLDITVYRTVTDIDGNVYRTVKIGDQWWMGENLKTTHYRNGDPIPNVTDNSEWMGLQSGAYCNYSNNNSYVEIRGCLYNWYAADDNRGLAPEGWHVPSDEEWKELEMHLGMSRLEADDRDWRGTDEGGKLKGTRTGYWEYPNTGATNESGFSALPGGLRNYIGDFYRIGQSAFYWSATECHGYAAWGRLLGFNNSGIYRTNYDKQYGSSVRCVRLSSTKYGSVPDIDGNVYKTVKIGDQWWMAENLKTTHYRNGDPIANITDDSEWMGLQTGAYCNYNNDTSFVEVYGYGRLYNYFAVDTSSGLAPEGWHVPSDQDWQILVDYLGGDAVAGGKLKESGIGHWFSPNTGATNEVGFRALPGGYRGYHGDCNYLGSLANFWSSSEGGSDRAWYRGLSCYSSNINRYNGYKQGGFSVRCVRD